jgi:hypothetical protein
LLASKKPAVPHFSVDGANFKRLLRNCTDKHLSMETWYDNIREAAAQKCLSVVCSEDPIEELAIKSLKDPQAFETEVRKLCRQFMVESCLYQENPIAEQAVDVGRDSEEDVFD